MKITASVAAYQEGLFLDYSLRSIEPFVDEIIITDTAMQASLDAGYAPRSTDATANILDKWIDNKKVFLAPSKTVPVSFKDLMNPAFELAKERGADWLFTVCGDEVWPETSLKPLRSFLAKCDNHGVLGLNVWMNIFAPDFWHCRDFRNPRLARIRPDAYLIAGDAVGWSNAYQFAGDLNNPYPPGTPDTVKVVNIDYPGIFKAFHYSCVGEERVKFKVDFYQKYDGTYGDRYNEAYIKKDWDAFVRYGYKPFAGKHPKIMEKHPLFNERLF